MATLNDIHFDLKELENLCKKYHILELRIFGSYATGTATENSDLDLLYVLDESQHIGWDFYIFWDELEKLFDKKIDLVPYKAVPENLKKFMIAPSKDFYSAA